MLVADHPRPTRRQDSGGDRHLKFHESRDNLTAGHLAEIHIGRLFLHSHTLMGVGHTSDYEVREVMRGLLRLIERGQVRPVVYATYPLAEIAKAHELMERSDFFGKIVLNP